MMYIGFMLIYFTIAIAVYSEISHCTIQDFIKISVFIAIVSVMVATMVMILGSVVNG